MYRHGGKRILDILLAATALLLLSPAMALVAVAIRLEDGGPVFFRQERVGRGEIPFTLLKFRSMPVSTAHVPSAEAKSARVTRVGTFIRRTNIDELPQLLNILLGEMSVVGPRPALPAQQQLRSFRSRLGAMQCRPGLTGLAQVNSYDGMPDKEKADWDGRYCLSVSFTGDVKIILRTFAYLLKPPPVY